MNDNSTIWYRRPEESDDDYLWRLGSLKESGIITLSWMELSFVFNRNIRSGQKPLDESTWRKKYSALALTKRLTQAELNEMMKTEEVVDEPANEAAQPEQDEAVNNPELTENPIVDFDAGKTLTRLRDERYAINRMVRSEARIDALLDLFQREIRKIEPTEICQTSIPREVKPGAVYAMLSDIHYGIAFDSSAGSYNAEIARNRVMDYADHIIGIANKNDVEVCYVSLLGDMISGIIHAPIRIENRENAVQQVVGVSELVADFLLRLSEHFSIVFVNSVSGNHSRLDAIAENALRAEKLDALIPWYCKAKLEKIDNVVFVENELDPTVCDFVIGEKLYVGVHGDYDKDLVRSATNIEQLANKHVDYMLAGHLHVPDIRIDNRGYIRNGSVCGSGDDYTMRNRLYCNPYQVCLTIDNHGDVESIYPIAL